MSCIRMIFPFCLLLAAGCSSNSSFQEETEEEVAEEAPSAPLLYLQNRGLDLLDIASARIAVGPGLLAHARATRWIAAGIGELGKPEPWGGFELKKYGLGWSLREGGLWTERRAELGISTFYYCETEAHLLGGNRDTFEPESRGMFDFGAELHLLLVGAAAEVRPDQAL
ncbi:MAG: hypothetical protein V2A76_03290, partial [Planctomycetota bacterium]